jgi:Cu/Zn superoxide dismutase
VLRARPRRLRPAQEPISRRLRGADVQVGDGPPQACKPGPWRHEGDLPSLLVKRNGTATLRATTDRFTLGDLRDRDGSAVMVHAGADNYANIPPRYAPTGPDQETLDTGDSGDRVACGRIVPG